VRQEFERSGRPFVVVRKSRRSDPAFFALQGGEKGIGGGSRSVSRRAK